MKTVLVVTATRAEYGLLYPLICALREKEDASFRVDLLVTGTHLSEKFGYTIIDIRNDNIRIDHEIPIPVFAKSEYEIVNNQAQILHTYACFFSKNKYDAVVILGDRYEMFMISIVAMNYKIPIIHLYGGDTTEGAIDECIRHAITKMSYLHFPTNEESRRRIIQMGEDPIRVFNYGATGADAVINLPKIDRGIALNKVGLKDCKYALCTYHPVTLEEVTIRKRFKDFLDALALFPEIEFIITKSNADLGGTEINELLEQECRSNLHVYSSIERKLYLSLMNGAEAVIGNSSSGILEAPLLHKPTVNIGDRQRGRLQVQSIKNCSPDKESIVQAIKWAISEDGKKNSINVKSPYGDGKASERIANKIFEVIQGEIELKKSFYNNIS